MQSTNADCKKAYKEGSFIGIIACHADCIIGIWSKFHASSPDTSSSHLLLSGKADLKFNQDKQPCCCSFCSWSNDAPVLNTNSIYDVWKDVIMTDTDSIWDYCVNGLEHQLPPNEDSSMIQFANAVCSISKDMNQFDKSKYPCAICDQLGHTFDTCPVLLATDLKEAYLCLLLLVKKFVKDLFWLDPIGKKHNNNLNVLCDVTLDQLHALKVLEDSPIDTVSSCVPSIDN